MVGGYISHYLLERARVVSQASEERNYHIFYMLCAGAPADLYKRLRLQPPDRFRYLSKGCSQYFCTKDSDKALGADRKSAEHAKKGPLRDPMLDDAKYFSKLDDGLKKLGMSDSVSLTFSNTSHSLGFQTAVFGSCNVLSTRGCCMPQRQGKPNSPSNRTD